MKKLIFKVVPVLLMVVLCITFASCDKNEEEKIVEKLMSKRWLYSEVSYETYSYGAAAGSETDCLYFLDEKYGVNVWGFKDVDSYFGTSRKSGKIFFSYTVQDKSVEITFLNDNTQSLTFNEASMDSGGNTYVGIDLTSDDKSRMSTWRTELVEAIDATGYEAAVNSGVLATIKRTDNFHHQLDITSNLAQKYPGKKIEYIVVMTTYVPKAKFGNGEFEYTFPDNNNLHLDNLFRIISNTSFFLDVYDSIKNKQNAGRSLTAAEQEELSAVTDVLNNDARYSSFEYFVKINDQKLTMPVKFI